MKGKSRRIKKTKRGTRRRGGSLPIVPKFNVGQTVIATTEDGELTGIIKKVEKLEGKYYYTVEDETGRGVLAPERKVRRDTNPS